MFILYLSNFRRKFFECLDVSNLILVVRHKLAFVEKLRVIPLFFKVLNRRRTQDTLSKYKMKFFVTRTICKVISQQTHQRRIKVETTLIINVHQCCFSVGIWQKMKVEPTYVYGCCFNVKKRFCFPESFEINSSQETWEFHMR